MKVFKVQSFDPWYFAAETVEEAIAKYRKKLPDSEPDEIKSVELLGDLYQ